MEVVLLRELSITLTELDNMDKKRKWMYYYYILEGKRREREESKKDYENQKNFKNKKPKKTPLDFKIEHKKIREEIDRLNEINPKIGSDPK